MKTIMIVVAAVVGTWLFSLVQTSGNLDVIGDAATQIVRPIVIPVVNLINQPSFVYIASAIIVLSAIVIALVYMVSVAGPQIDASTKAIDAIEGLPRAVPGQWEQTLSDVQAILAKNNVMLSPWTTFSQQATEERRLPARRFALFVQEDAQNPLNERDGTMASLPGYYTTIGLILTFVGLVVALYFAAKGFRSGDMTEARGAIVQLLNASAFKFLTSVAALVSALGLSLAHRFTQDRLRQKSWHLITAIDVHLLTARASDDRISPQQRSEQALVEKLDALVNELAQTRLALRTLEHAMKQERA